MKSTPGWDFTMLGNGKLSVSLEKNINKQALRPFISNKKQNKAVLNLLHLLHPEK